jgi:hypothetical protein
VLALGHGETNSAQSFLVRSSFNNGRLAAPQYPPASCQLRTHAPQQREHHYSINLVGTTEQREWDREAERLGASCLDGGRSKLLRFLVGIQNFA